jgi:hypothetical protein
MAHVVAYLTRKRWLSESWSGNMTHRLDVNTSREVTLTTSTQE